ncbi:MAG: hypothetical protein GY952_14045 [Rhodobacteraceae bacterium]|nr:hypothetical protein [Paracoccaceae bacterium]
MDNGWVRITERFTINGVKYISSCFVRGDYEKAAISFPDEGLAHIDAGGGDLEIMDVSLKYDQEDIPAHNPALWSDAPTKWVVSNGSVTAGQR